MTDAFKHVVSVPVRVDNHISKSERTKTIKSVLEQAIRNTHGLENMKYIEPDELRAKLEQMKGN